MQVLYANEQGAFPSEDLLQKNVLDNIHNIFRSYLQALLLIEKIVSYVKKDIDTALNKLLSKEHNISSKILNNPIIEYLSTNESFLKKITIEKIDTHIDQEFLKNLYKKVVASDYYSNYVNIDNLSIENHIEVIANLIKETIADDEDIDLWLEESFPSWQYDKHIVMPYILKSVKQFDKEKSFPLEFNWKEEIEFAKGLTNKTAKGNSYFKDLIQSKAKNWEVDRITMIDMLLMKMALCELIEFPSIPIKVTMDEYIEISKLYSTPKSKDFINGIIDKLAHQLKEEGKIAKTGRGLVD